VLLWLARAVCAAHAGQQGEERGGGRAADAS
jgi:hypothetical protein